MNVFTFMVLVHPFVEGINQERFRSVNEAQAIKCTLRLFLVHFLSLFKKCICLKEIE